MKILDKLFGGPKADIDFDELFAVAEDKPSIVILSSSCCNPLAIPGDTKLKEHVTAALSNLDINTEIHTLTITNAQAHMSSLPEQHKELGTKLMGLFQSKGIGAFPALLINGDLVFYGGIPEVEQIEEKLAAILARTN